MPGAEDTGAPARGKKGRQKHRCLIMEVGVRPLDVRMVLRLGAVAFTVPRAVRPGHGGADQNLEMAGKAADLHAVCSTGGASPLPRARCNHALNV